MKILQKVDYKMSALLTMILVIAIGLYCIGGSCALLWLAIFGEWSAIGKTILFVLLLRVDFIVTPLANLFSAKKFAVGRVIYLATLIILWCVFVWWLFLTSANENLLPLIICAYVVAITPLIRVTRINKRPNG